MAFSEEARRHLPLLLFLCFFAHFLPGGRPCGLHCPCGHRCLPFGARRKVLCMHRAFDYSNPDALSWKIIRGGAFYVRIPDGGTCLDVGHGSGALTIAVAK